MRLNCPKHPNELLRQTFVSVYEKVKGKKPAKRSRTTDFLYCEKCDKCYLPKVTF